MKTLILTALASALLTLGASAQRRTSIPSGQPRVEVGHTLAVDLLGVDYNYEQPLARTVAVIGRVGVNFGAAWPGRNGGDWRTGVAIPYGDYTMIAPAVELEPRWYYGLDRRAGRGRSTDGNAGSFVSLRMQSMLHPIGHDARRRSGISGMTTFAPTWGLRRMWGGHWAMEFTTGVRFGVRHDGLPLSPDGDAVDHLDLNLRFGYTF
jgi:hypothetical protein